jgi:lysophospholipase
VYHPSLPRTPRPHAEIHTDLCSIPIEPLITPYRNVDAIIAFDGSADTTYSYPNGSAMYTTYTRSRQLELNQDVKVRMPEVPSTNGFINGGLNQRPTFFGCNRTDTPIIVYVPLYPWSYYGNTSTVS